MSCDVHSYEYIRSHLDEYSMTMVEANREVNDTLKELYPNGDGFTPDLYSKSVFVTFYKKLLDNREMSVPERCVECPFHSVRFNSLSQMCDECDINIGTYVGNQFFASSKEKPKWCPLIKEVQT